MPRPSGHTSTPKATEAVQITLYSGKDGYDEKAKVRVEMPQAEAMMQRMIETLAQRFPPESVMTITAGAKSVLSGTTSDDDTSHTSQNFSEDDILRESIIRGFQSKMSLSPEITNYLSTLSLEGLQFLAGLDPAVQRHLLALDVPTLDQYLRLEPAAFAELMDAMVRESRSHPSHEGNKQSGRSNPSSRNRSSKHGRGSRNGSHAGLKSHPSHGSHPALGGHPSHGSHSALAGHPSHGGHASHPSHGSQTLTSHPSRASHQDHPSLGSHPSRHSQMSAARGAIKTTKKGSKGSSGESGKSREGGSRLHMDSSNEMPVRYVEVEVVEEILKHVPKKHVVFKERKVPVVNVVYLEKFEEVVETRVITKEVEVVQVVDQAKYVKKVEIVDVPIERINHVKKICKRVVEREVEVPGPIVEVPKYYKVENRVLVPTFQDREVPTVVAQLLQPVVIEGGDVEVVDCVTIDPFLVPVDVFIPKVVKTNIASHGKVDEMHRVVQIPPAQYNALVRQANPMLSEEHRNALFVKSMDGSVPILPANEHVEIVNPLSSDWANTRVPGQSYISSGPRSHSSSGNFVRHGSRASKAFQL